MGDSYLGIIFAIVGKVENGRGCSAAGGGQTNEFSQFKVNSICLPMFLHCGSFGRPLPHAKLIGTNLETGTCSVTFRSSSQMADI